VNAEAAGPAALDSGQDPAAADSKVPFSLFEGDGLQFVYTQLGLSNYARFHVVKRCLLAVMLTWVPLAALALRQGPPELRPGDRK